MVCGTHLDGSKPKHPLIKAHLRIYKSWMMSLQRLGCCLQFQMFLHDRGEVVSLYFARKTHLAQRCVKACDLSRQKQTPGGEQKLMCIEFHVTCSSWECLWKGKSLCQTQQPLMLLREEHERTGKTVENYGGSKLHKSKIIK